MRKQRIYGLWGLLVLFGLFLFSAGLPFLQAEEIPHLELEPIEREDVIKRIVLIVVFFVLAVLGFIKGLYFLLRRPSLLKGVIMGIGMIPFVILITYLSAWIVAIALEHRRLWWGWDIEMISFTMSAFIILLITPIMFLIVHKRDSRKPEEQKKIFTNSALIRAKKGGIISLGPGIIIIGLMLRELLEWGMTPNELLFFALLLFPFIASLIIFIKVPLRKILDIFIPLYFIPLLFAILSVLLSMWRMIGIRYLLFAAEHLVSLLMILGLGYIGVLIGIFSGYITQKKRAKIFTKSDMWITALFTLLIPLTLASLSFTIFILIWV